MNTTNSIDIDPAELHRQFSAGNSWDTVGARYGLSGNAARKRVKRWKKQHQITGSSLDVPEGEHAEIWRRALMYTERQHQVEERRANQRVVFDSGPLLLAFVGDLHLGSMGTDYMWLHQDLTLLESLAEQGVQVGVILVGDLIDNFIIGRLQDLRKLEAPFTTIEEWGLVDIVLERLAPFLIASCAGNHDNWTFATSGVDYLAERHKALTPGILYDRDELLFVLQVGDAEWRVMVRHRWRGGSQWNATHAIEKAAKFGSEFDIGIAGHTHRGALAREFNNGGQLGYAVLVGSYKREDSYARKLGLPQPPGGVAVGMLLDDDGRAMASSDLFMLGRAAVALTE
jgi:UDP-2,3-diacylglucosamine pyrophosphatase LpxH